MEKLRSIRKETWIKVFLIIFFGVGVSGLGYQPSRDFFIGLMPFSLLLGMGIMFAVHPHWSIKLFFILITIAILGFFIEVLGVLTGVVFGEYSYGRALGVKIWGTPPMIGLNWMMLIYAVHEIMQRTKWSVWIQIIAGSGLMVIYDYIMEPVAIRLDMWSWGGGDIPLQNYIAWFVISLVMLSIMHISRIKYKNSIAPWLFFIQMVFFLILNLIKYYQA